VLGLVGGLVIAPGRYAVAQTPPQPQPPIEQMLATPPTPRLTLRPRELATAARTQRAGWQTLDGKPLALRKPPPWVESARHLPADPKTGYAPRWEDPCCFITAYDSVTGHFAGYLPAVYVPKVCVGARRCPLVLLPASPGAYYSRLADKYGMITAFLGGESPGADTVNLDGGLRRILGAFAIDPDKIAIGPGQYHMHEAIASPAVFSRVFATTHGDGNIPAPPARPEAGAPTQELYFGASVFEFQGVARVQQLRKRGYRVTHAVEFRGHAHTDEEYDFLGRWLQQTWAAPDLAQRPVPYTLGEPPLLTADILRLLTPFWTRFLKLPNSIIKPARRRLSARSACRSAPHRSRP